MIFMADLFKPIKFFSSLNIAMVNNSKLMCQAHIVWTLYWPFRSERDEISTGYFKYASLNDNYQSVWNKCNKCEMIYVIIFEIKFFSLSESLRDKEKVNMHKPSVILTVAICM